LLQITFLFDLCFEKKQRESENSILEKVLEIGVLSGDENFIFGAITDIELDRSGNIYALDNKLHRIVKYNKEGEFILRFGKHGQGPGEFDFPEAITIDRENRICVLDTGKVHIFRDNGKFILSFRYDFYGIDISKRNCAELMILGPQKGNIFHVFDYQGKYKYSFGNLMSIPREFGNIKGTDLFRTPLKLWPIGDKIYILNPYRYEIHVYEKGFLKKKISMDSPDYLRPELRKISQGGFVAYVSDNLIHIREKHLYVFYNGKTANWVDIFRDDKLIRRLKVKGTLKAIDLDGKFYFAEGEDFPRIAKYNLR
jgi:hypothetical protein